MYIINISLEKTGEDTMKAYIDNNTYSMYAEDSDIIIGDIASAARNLMALNLEIREILVFATSMDVDTQYFRNIFKNDETQMKSFQKYIGHHFARGMSVDIYRNRMVVYYNDAQFYLSDNNLYIESVKIVCGN